MAKDAKGHGSDGRGGVHPADAAYAARQKLASERVVPALVGSVTADIRNQNGIASDQQAAATLAQGHPKSAPVPIHAGAAGRGMTLHAEATENKASGEQDHQQRTYRYNGSNRKAGINFAMKKINSEFPNHRSHYVRIAD